MIFKTSVPGQRLAEYIADIVYYRGYTADHDKERMLPDGAVYIVIDLTPDPKYVFNKDQYGKKTALRRGWLSGVKSSYITMETVRNGHMLVVRFRPGRAAPFFRFPISLVTDAIVELEAVWGSAFTALYERILNTFAINEKISLLEAFLLRQFSTETAGNSLIFHSVDQLADAQFSGSIRMISDAAGYSHKHFINIFKNCTGLTPRLFTRIIKFNRILERIERDDYTAWPQIALLGGYYDQAHFINEFRKFSGINPGLYLERKSEYPLYVREP